MTNPSLMTIVNLKIFARVYLSNFADANFRGNETLAKWRETTLSLMPMSHIHGSPRRFHYESNLMDDPGNANFRSPIRMHNVMATGFDVSTKD